MTCLALAQVQTPSNERVKVILPLFTVSSAESAGPPSIATFSLEVAASITSAPKALTSSSVVIAEVVKTSASTAV